MDISEVDEKMQNSTILEVEEETEFYDQEDENESEELDIESNQKDTRKIIWQAKDFSIREFQAMEQDGDLILQPDYQRKYVMDIKLASRLVESILMDVPIPVIYLAEESDGRYSVIDGQQRLTSFISFLHGKFPDGKEFILSGLKVLKELNRFKFADLDKEYQMKIKTTTIHTIIIKRESHEDIKFEIFERLNTGSIKLNEDEIRNTMYRGSYIKLLSELERNILFHQLVRKDNFKKRMIYRGMILRFFAFSEKSYLNYKPSMKQFCNKELRDNQNMGAEKINEYKERFIKCLDLVKTIFGDNAFRRFKPGDNDSTNGDWTISRINMALFDIQMCGFLHYDKHQIIQNADRIREALIELMSYNDEFIAAIEIKTSDRNSVKKRFKIWSETIENILDGTYKQDRTFSYSVKKSLFETDPTCKICGQQILTIDDAEVDHIVPFSKGGDTSNSNAQISHRFCNRVKSDN